MFDLSIANSFMKDKKINDLLYIDESGELSTLFDVQLMEDIPTQRIPKLIKLLASKDRYINYQAMLLLIAWGVEEGFNQLDFFIENELDATYEYEPHRIWGADNVYDHIAESLLISTYNTHNVEKITPYLNRFLSFYSEKFFDSKLKDVLLKIRTKLDEPFQKEFSEGIVRAIDQAIKSERYFQASQLLPVLAHYEKSKVHDYISKFESLLTFDKRIRYNLDEVV